MLLFLILVLGFLLRVINLNQSFWLDEAAQLIESSRPLYQQFNIKGDFQPPLFHLLLHFWLYFGKSEIIIRLLPILFGTVTIFFVYKIATYFTNAKVALVAALLLAISPFHIWYSQEVRPYVLATLLGAAATHFLLRKSLTYYVLSTALLLYTMYLTPFLLIGHGVYVFLFQKKWFKEWFKAIGISLILFLPWAPSFLEQLSIGSSLRFTLPGWSEAVSASIVMALPLTFIKFIIGRISFENNFLYGCITVVFFIIFILCIWSAFRKFPKTIKELLVIFLVPLLTAFIAHLILPIFAPQRLLFLLPFFYLLFAIGIFTLKNMKWIPVGLLIGVSFYSLYLYNTNPEFQREHWREAIEYVEAERTESSQAVFIFPDAFAPWQWYSNEIVSALAIAPTFTIKEIEMIQFKEQFLASDRLFYFHYLSDLTDPQKISQTFIKNIGFVEQQTLNFPGVGFVTIYEKTLAYY